MKRLISVLMAIMLLCSLCACDKPQTAQQPGQAAQTPEPRTEVQQPEPEPEQTAPSPAQQGDERLAETYKIPLQEIYIDVPGAPYHRVEHGLTDLYSVSDQYGVGITQIDITSDGTSLVDACESCIEKYSSNLEGKITVIGINISERNAVTINGIDCIQYTGTYTYEYGDATGEAFTKGYAFILDGVSISIEGTVFDYDQPQDEIDEIRSIVDAMIHTVRTTK